MLKLKKKYWEFICLFGNRSIIEFQGQNQGSKANLFVMYATKKYDETSSEIAKVLDRSATDKKKLFAYKERCLNSKADGTISRLLELADRLAVIILTFMLGLVASLYMLVFSTRVTGENNEVVHKMLEILQGLGNEMFNLGIGVLVAILIIAAINEIVVKPPMKKWNSYIDFWISIIDDRL